MPQSAAVATPAPPARLARLARGAALVASTALACGPSFQVVYEGDARFEHCYALDDMPTVPMDEKSVCWTQWMKSYTYGQTRNRVDYAAMRAKALTDVPALPTDEALMSAAPGGGTGRLTHDEPAPTNAFTTPPKTQREGDAGPEPTPPTAVELAPQAPRAHCTDRCRTQWQGCESTCKTKCVECETAYSGCMKGCF